MNRDRFESFWFSYIFLPLTTILLVIIGIVLVVALIYGLKAD